MKYDTLYDCTRDLKVHIKNVKGRLQIIHTTFE